MPTYVGIIITPLPGTPEVVVAGNGDDGQR
jgi:hypothetical protein